MGQLGMGVMLGMLSGNEESVSAIRSSLNKTISLVYLDDDSQLKFKFSDGTSLTIWDDGQCCCEARYMRTDDILTEFIGATLLYFELKDAPSTQDREWDDVHEIQFLDVKTDKGVFQIASHNEHNGYYGGFWIKAVN